MIVGREAGDVVATQCVPDRKPEFSQRLSAVQAKLYGYLHSLVPDINDTDDLYQQTVLILWHKFGEYDTTRDFFAWACGVARGEVANFARRRTRQRLYLAADVNLLLVESHATMPDQEHDDRKTALSGCIEKLPTADRELLSECYLDRDGVQAAADRRGRSSHSVYNSLRRIRKLLFECIGRTVSAQSSTGGK